MSAPAFYENPVLLRHDVHRNATLRLAPDFSFATNANSVFVAVPEFEEAAKSLAIVFSEDSEKRTVPMVVVGVRQAENLLIDDVGAWKGGYIPAYIRRYPFVLAELAPDQLGVCIDERWMGSSADDGLRLFDDAGERTSALQQAMDFLDLFQREYQRTLAICARWEAAGLFNSVNITLDKDESIVLGNLKVIDAEKLNSLGDLCLAEMVRNGELASINAHLASLSNLQKLIPALHEKQASASCLQ